MKAFQLKIVIKNSKPPIWRRVIVPAGITFSQLSMILNEVMGWSGYHSFEVEFYHLELRIIEDADEFMDIGYGPYDYLEASTTYIREYLEENDWFTYTYDLGDDWQHRVTVEKIIDDYSEEYPRVIKYKGNCPPEDCGGIYGYYDYMDIIKDENHPEYEERLAWLEMQGYPCEYDMEAVNHRLQERYFYRWGKGEKRMQSELYEDIYNGRLGLCATKKDKNKNSQIIKSGKHVMEESFQKMADMLKYSVFQPEEERTTLEAVFSDFEKEDLKEIARDKGLTGISGLNKNKLIERIVAYMLKPEVMEQYFLCLGDAEIEEFEKAARADGLYESRDCNNLMSLYEANYVGMVTDGRVVVPKKVAEIYRSFKDAGFEDERKKRSYLLYCLRASGILHGIVPEEVLMQLVNRNPDVRMTVDEVREKIEKIPPEFSESVILNHNVYQCEFYPDDRGLLQVQGNKEYYIPSYEEIICLGTKGSFPVCKQARELKKYLTGKMNVFVDEIDFVIGIIQRKICSGCDMQEVFDTLEEFGMVLENDRQLEGLVKRIHDLWNHTRMLTNRGFTPNELRKQSTGIPAPHGQSGSGEIIPFSQAKSRKVYPNDLCPCGSGKKYKNCCKNKN